MEISNDIKIYVRSQSICNQDELTEMIRRVSESKLEHVLDILQLMLIGFGWGEFALSVLRQNIFTERQIMKIKEMRKKTSNHSPGMWLESSQRIGRMSDGDYEELDMVGWDGHGF